MDNIQVQTLKAAAVTNRQAAPEDGGGIEQQRLAQVESSLEYYEFEYPNPERRREIREVIERVIEEYAACCPKPQSTPEMKLKYIKYFEDALTNKLIVLLTDMFRGLKQFPYIEVIGFICERVIDAYYHQIIRLDVAGSNSGVEFFACYFYQKAHAFFNANNEIPSIESSELKRKLADKILDTKNAGSSLSLKTQASDSFSDDWDALELENEVGLYEHDTGKLLLRENNDALYVKYGFRRAVPADKGKYFVFKNEENDMQRRSEINKALLVTKTSFLLSLIRKVNQGNTEHAFIIIEGISADTNPHFVWYSDLVTRDGVNSIIQMEAIERNQTTHSLLAELKVNNLRDVTLTARSWQISERQAKIFMDNIRQESTQIETGELVIPYQILGIHSVLTSTSSPPSSQKGHSCWTWATEKINRLEDVDVNVDITVVDKFVAVPSRHIRNPDTPASPNDDSDRCCRCVIS